MKMHTGEQSRKPLRIIHLASGDLWAGAETQLYTLASTLNSFEEVKISVVLLNEGILAGKLRDQGVSVTIYDESKLSTTTILQKLIAMCWSEKPDIIHTHRQKENVLGSIACALTKGCRSVRTVHGAREHPPSIRAPHKLAFFILDMWCGRFFQKKIISVSDELAKDLSQTFSPNKVTTIYNGVDIERMVAQSQKPVAALPGNPASKKVGIFARLVPVKRIDLFIELAAYLKHAGNEEFGFYIFGDGPLLEEIKSKIKTLELQNIVHLIGHVENSAPFLAKMDVVLFTSDHEGLPMTLLESLAVGTPVVSPRIGGISRVLDHPSLKFLVEQRDNPGYSALITEIISSQYRVKKEDPIYQRLVADYSSTSNARAVLKTYQKLKNRA